MHDRRQCHYAEICQDWQSYPGKGLEIKLRTHLQRAVFGGRNDVLDDDLPLVSFYD
jgi:hypothetical protein